VFLWSFDDRFTFQPLFAVRIADRSAIFIYSDNSAPFAPPTGWASQFVEPGEGDAKLELILR
jgi:hypothetical protein